MNKPNTKTQKEITKLIAQCIGHGFNDASSGKRVVDEACTDFVTEKESEFLSLLSSHAEQVRLDALDEFLITMKQFNEATPEIRMICAKLKADTVALSSTEQGECRCECHVLGENNPKKCTNENCQGEGK